MPAGSRNTPEYFSLGCLGWLAGGVILGGLLVYGAVAYTSSGTAEGDPPAPPSASVAGPVGLPSPSVADERDSGCTDVTAAFKDSTPSDRTLERVARVCWEPTGGLRADLDYPADIEAASRPMTWLCGALTSFITGSGKDWHGFTAYSTAAVSPGQMLLTRSEPGQPCT